MQTTLVSIGCGNVISSNRIIAIVSAESSESKKMIQRAKDGGLCIDSSDGKKIRSVIISDSGHVTLSPIMPETLANRMNLGNTQIFSRSEGGLVQSNVVDLDEDLEKEWTGRI